MDGVVRIELFERDGAPLANRRLTLGELFDFPPGPRRLCRFNWWDGLPRLEAYTLVVSVEHPIEGRDELHISAWVPPSGTRVSPSRCPDCGAGQSAFSMDDATLAD